MTNIHQEILEKGAELHQNGQFQLAEKMYSAVIDLDQDHADANHNMGLLKMNMGRDLDALPFFQTAITADNSVAQFWHSYVQVLINLNRLEDAKRIIELSKDNGIECNRIDQLEQNLKQLEEKLSFNSSSFENNANRLVESIGSASSSVSKIIESQEPSHDQLNDLIVSLNKGLSKQVVDQVDEMLERLPKSFSLFNIRGVANAKVGRHSVAIIDYKQAVQIKPDFAEAYNNLGVALKFVGENLEAINNFEYAVSINSDYADALNNLGVAYNENGDVKKAIEMFQRAIVAKPNFAAAEKNLSSASIFREQDSCTNSVRSQDYKDKLPGSGFAFQVGSSDGIGLSVTNGINDVSEIILDLGTEEDRVLDA